MTQSQPTLDTMTTPIFFASSVPAAQSSAAIAREGDQSIDLVVRQDHHWSRGNENCEQCAEGCSPSMVTSRVGVSGRQPKCLRRTLRCRVYKAKVLAQLYRHLQQLSPHRRREFIAQNLTQAQRLALEQWMLQRASERRKRVRPSAHHVNFQVNALTICDASYAPRKKSVIAKTLGGYRICLSLSCNFYVQSVICKSHQQSARVLDMLLTLRRNCQFASSQGRSHKACLVSCVADLRKQPLPAGREANGLRFRTQLSFGRGHRLSSPLRSDPGEACDDCQQLTQAWTCSLFSGSQLRTEYSPDLAKKQWLRSCQAWRNIWIPTGRCPLELERSLMAKERALRPRWAEAEARWKKLQAKTAAKISRLLAAWPHCSTEARIMQGSFKPTASVSTRSKKRKSCQPFRQLKLRTLVAIGKCQGFDCVPTPCKFG